MIVHDLLNDIHHSVAPLFLAFVAPMRQESFLALAYFSLFNVPFAMVARLFGFQRRNRSLAINIRTVSDSLRTNRGKPAVALSAAKLAWHMVQAS